MALLSLNNEFIKTCFYILIQSIHKHEKLIKIIEYIRGLYRYPNKMLGRKVPYEHVGNTDVLVFAAHPDDEILGLGTILYRHSLNGENIKVIFVTNGSGRGGESWYLKTSEGIKKTNVRHLEAVQALSHINISKENIFCLGFPDGGSQRYLKKMSDDILELVQKLNPDRIYAHCIEGGHRDHDITSLVVKSVCNKLGYSNLYEWTEYNYKHPLGSQEIKFLKTHSTQNNEIRIKISEDERSLKRKMLACHNSQDVEQYFLQGEAIRQVDLSKLEIEINEDFKRYNKRVLPLVKEFYKSVFMLYVWVNFPTVILIKHL